MGRTEFHPNLFSVAKLDQKPQKTHIHPSGQQEQLEFSCCFSGARPGCPCLRESAHDIAVKNKCIVSACSSPKGKHYGCKQDQETICIAGDVQLQITPVKRGEQRLPSNSCRALTEGWDLWHVVE